MEVVTYRRGQKRVRGDYSPYDLGSSKRVRFAVRGALRAPLRTGGFYGASRYRRLGPRIRKILKYWSPPEQKFSDTNASGASLTTPQVILLNGLAQGTTVNTRIGNRVTFTVAQGRMSFYYNTTTSAPTVRCMLVWDSQANSATATLAEVLQNSGGGTNFLSPNNLNNRDRFKVLWDKSYQLNDQDGQRKTVKFYKKIKMVTTYDGTTAGFGDISTGSLHMYIMSSESGATFPLVDYYFRVRFIDN